jgi:hypothetical protein
VKMPVPPPKNLVAPQGSPGRPLPIPPRPAPVAVRENAVKSLTCAVLALGLSANDCRVYPTEHACTGPSRTPATFPMLLKAHSARDACRRSIASAK